MPRLLGESISAKSGFVAAGRTAPSFPSARRFARAARFGVVLRNHLQNLLYHIAAVAGFFGGGAGDVGEEAGVGAAFVGAAAVGFGPGQFDFFRGRQQ